MRHVRRGSSGWLGLLLLFSRLLRNLLSGRHCNGCSARLRHTSVRRLIVDLRVFRFLLHANRGLQWLGLIAVVHAGLERNGGQLRLSARFHTCLRRTRTQERPGSIR